jgi:hypothetical protein
MQLKVKRIAKKPTYTVGKLYINEEYFCDTLEDTDRGLNNKMSYSEIANIKIKSKTAIPTGTYTISITYSSRFKKNMPLISKVPGFSGIRIHSGNSSEDTEGCILVGKNTKVGMVTDSRLWYNKLYKILDSAVKSGDSIRITIS